MKPTNDSERFLSDKRCKGKLGLIRKPGLKIETIMFPTYNNILHGSATHDLCPNPKCAPTFHLLKIKSNSYSVSSNNHLVPPPSLPLSFQTTHYRNENAVIYIRVQVGTEFSVLKVARSTQKKINK